jgi:hypothetical protein
VKVAITYVVTYLTLLVKEQNSTLYISRNLEHTLFGEAQLAGCGSIQFQSCDSDINLFVLRAMLYE